MRDATSERLEDKKKKQDKDRKNKRASSFKFTLFNFEIEEPSPQYIEKLKESISKKDNISLRKKAQEKVHALMGYGNVLHFNKEVFADSCKDNKFLRENYALFEAYFMQNLKEKLKHVSRKELVRRLAFKRGADHIRHAHDLDETRLLKRAAIYGDLEIFYIESFYDGLNEGMQNAERKRGVSQDVEVNFSTSSDLVTARALSGDDDTECEESELKTVSITEASSKLSVMPLTPQPPETLLYHYRQSAGKLEDIDTDADQVVCSEKDKLKSSLEKFSTRNFKM